MGLTRDRLLAAVLFSLPAILTAAPRLSLSTTALGPISIAQGGNGGTQTVEAGNIGDGTLSAPTLSSSVSWISASVGAQRTCITMRAAQCFPLQLALNTAQLPAGLSTGIVTVNAPNAIDAPQTITVTVQMGGPLPGGVDVTIGQGKSADFKFYTNKFLDASQTKSSAPWLSIVLDGVGSFTFGVPYHLHLAAAPSMPTGTYAGTATLAGSSDPIDNRQVNVTLHVTDQPVAVSSVDKVRVRLAVGAPPLITAVTLNNVGLGTLTVSDVSVTGGSWVTGQASGAGAVLKFDSSGLSPGVYNGSISFTTNTVAALPAVPIEFTVVPQGPPVISFNGVVDNAIFGAGDALTAGDVAVVLGEQLSFQPLTVGPAPPLATTIGGAQVLVNGSPAPMYYSSYGQLAFQVPFGLSTIDGASVQVTRDGQASNTVAMKIAPRAPRLLSVGGTSFGAITLADGTLPLPAGTFPGLDTHPAHAGDTLVIYAIGLGPTSPGVPVGQAAPSSEPLSRLTSTPVVNMFNTGSPALVVQPSFAGLTPTYAGLYQVNVTVPANSPKGTVNITLGFNDAISNAVQLAIQ